MSDPTILNEAALFQGLTTEQLEMIVKISQIKTYNLHDCILEQGAISDEMYVVISGEVDVYIDSAYPNKPETGIRLTTLRRGQCFGEMTLVDQGRRAASVCCGRENTEVLVIPRNALIELCERETGLGYRLMQNLAIDLAAKVRTSDVRLKEWLAVDVD